MERVIEANINTPEVWDAHYQTPEGLRNTSWNCHSAVTVLSAVLPPNAHVLDCACGTAFGPLRVSERRPDLVWSGCDFSQQVVARNRASGFPWHRMFQADLTRIEEFVPSRQYDVIAACEVLEHLEDPASVAQSVARLATRQAIITVPYRNRVPTMYHLWSIDEPDLRVWLEPFGRVETYIVRFGTKLIAVCDKR